MATLVKCDHCGVLTYSLRPGDACDSCNLGFMQTDDAETDFRGCVDRPSELMTAAEAAADVDLPDLPVRITKDASAFGVDQPDNQRPVADIEAQPRKGPKVTGHDGADLWDLLRDGAFHKAKDLDMESRKIRAVCAVYPNQFLSTQRGYKIVKKASDDEIENAIADLRSRMSHLNRRASALESVLRDRSQPGFDV